MAGNGSLLDYYAAKRAERRATRTQERRLGYAEQGVEISTRRANEFRAAGDFAMLSGNHDEAIKQYRRYRGARAARADAVFEALDRSAALGR